jgi:hypothetical protein
MYMAYWRVVAIKSPRNVWLVSLIFGQRRGSNTNDSQFLGKNSSENHLFGRMAKAMTSQEIECRSDQAANNERSARRVDGGADQVDEFGMTSSICPNLRKVESQSTYALESMSKSIGGGNAARVKKTWTVATRLVTSNYG